MEFLQEFSEREEISALVRNAMSHDSVHGVTLQVDNYWSNAWFLEQSIGRPKLQHRLRATWGLRFYFGMRPYLEGFDNDEDELSRNFLPPTHSDLEKWEPPFWKEYLETLGENRPRFPILMKILLYPPTGNERIRPPELEPISQLMMEFATREPGVLFSNPKRSYRPVLGGVSIGVGSAHYGTLGGIVKDSVGKRYALTCAHVVSHSVDVDQPAQIDSSAATKIGKRARTSMLKTCASTSAAPCTCWSGGKPVNSVDAALIELDSPISSKMEILDIGVITGIRRNFMPPLAVEITGRSSKNRSLRIGALVAAIRLSDNKGDNYCYSNLFEVKWPRFSRVILSRPIQSGDSGAWVCAASGSGFDFLGMIVGGNRTVGYANLSRTIEDWWMVSESLSLSVV